MNLLMLRLLRPKMLLLIARLVIWSRSKIRITSTTMFKTMRFRLP